jgi:hypothetical protein
VGEAQQVRPRKRMGKAHAWNFTTGGGLSGLKQVRRDGCAL